ncbi:MAG: hypothetical protein NTX03_01300 [Bacteroidetes bacterium]|nr:hypothetical protein [Bacteroidota bacterium]
MKPVVISPKNNEELKFVNQILAKLGIASRPLTEEEIEDYNLAMLVKQADRTKKVSRETIMKKQ